MDFEINIKVIWPSIRPSEWEIITTQSLIKRTSAIAFLLISVGLDWRIKSMQEKRTLSRPMRSNPFCKCNYATLDIVTACNQYYIYIYFFFFIYCYVFIHIFLLTTLTWSTRFAVIVFCFRCVSILKLSVCFNILYTSVSLSFCTRNCQACIIGCIQINTTNGENDI